MLDVAGAQIRSAGRFPRKLQARADRGVILIGERLQDHATGDLGRRDCR